MSKKCPVCEKDVEHSWYYCPHCGAKLYVSTFVQAGGRKRKL